MKKLCRFFLVVWVFAVLLIPLPVEARRDLQIEMDSPPISSPGETAMPVSRSRRSGMAQDAPSVVPTAANMGLTTMTRARNTRGSVVTEAASQAVSTAFASGRPAHRPSTSTSSYGPRMNLTYTPTPANPHYGPGMNATYTPVPLNPRSRPYMNTTNPGYGPGMNSTYVNTTMPGFTPGMNSTYTPVPSNPRPRPTMNTTRPYYGNRSYTNMNDFRGF